jgi:hypothetical protein
LLPASGDSLYFYSKQCDRLCGLGKGWLEIPPEEAMAYMGMGERFGTVPVRGGEQSAYAGKRARRVAERIFPLPGRARGPLHHYFSQFFDWNEPPLFKNFLRLDVRKGELTIRCFAATGCLDHEKNPPVEDVVMIPLDTSGSHDRREQAPR